MSFIKDTFFGGAEKKAARAQQQGIDRGVQEQRRQFDLTRSDLAPSIGAGNDARTRLMELLGLLGPDAEQTAVDNFQESPGQAFLRKRGERAVKRNSSAVGGLGGGDVLKALTEHGIGVAAQQLGERKDRLSQLSGIGSQVAVQGGSLGQDTAANIAGLFQDRGTAGAEGIIGRKSAITGSLEKIIGAFI